MAYEGGYTSAVNSNQQRAMQEQARQASLQQMVQAALMFQQQQEATQRQRQARATLGDMLPELAQMGTPPPQGPQPQPPMPGQASVPMAPPPPAANMAMRGPPGEGPMPGQMGAPPGAAPAAMPGMPPGGMPAAAGAPPGAGAPAGGPPGWQPMPKPPAAAPAGPGGLSPPPEDGAVLSKQVLTVADLAKALNSKGIKGEQALDMIDQWAPYMDSSNKAQLAGMKIELQAQTAAANAYAKALQAGASVKRADTDQERLRTVQQPTAAARIKKLTNPGTGGTMQVKDEGDSYVVNAGGKSTSVKKATADYYARQSLAGDNSWQVGLARGAVGQAIIAVVKDRIPELAAESGITAEEGAAAKGKRDSITSALRDRQKFVSASNQFVNNFDKQIDIVDKYLKPGLAGSVPIINKWVQAGRKAIAGDPDVTALDTAMRGLAREHQRIVTGVTSNAQLHVSAQETADALLNKDMTEEQVRSTLKVMREEAKNAREAGMTEVDFLTDQLKHLGVGGAKPSTPPAGGGAKPASGDYIEIRKTKDNRTLGRKKDGTIEEISGAMAQ